MTEQKPRTRSKAKPKPDKVEKPVQAARPASTPEAREQQLVSLAVNLAEKQLRDGTAAPSEIGRAHV